MNFKFVLVKIIFSEGGCQFMIENKCLIHNLNVEFDFLLE